MRIYNKTELLVVSVAMRLDQYAFDYAPYDYADNVGTDEICRVRHVNDLIQAIANSGSEFIGILKNMSEDIDYLNYNLAEKYNRENAEQLKEAQEILEILGNFT